MFIIKYLIIKINYTKNFIALTVVVTHVFRQTLYLLRDQIPFWIGIYQSCDHHLLYLK